MDSVELVADNAETYKSEMTKASIHLESAARALMRLAGEADDLAGHLVLAPELADTSVALARASIEVSRTAKRVSEWAADAGRLQEYAAARTPRPEPDRLAER